MPNLLPDDRFNNGVLFTFDTKVDYEIYITPKIKAPENTFLEYGEYNGNIFYRLSDVEKEETVGLLQTKIIRVNGKEMQELKNIEVVEEMRGKGCAHYLHQACFSKHNIPSISDNYQTFSSVNHWKKLRFKWRQKKYRIGYIDVNTGKVYKWDKKTKEYLLWGMSNQFFDDIEEMSFDDYGAEEIIYDMFVHHSISKQHYLFLKDNLENLRDRDNIRLYVDRL